MDTTRFGYLPATHTHLFNGPLSGTTQWAGTRKVKPIWILLKQETVSGSGISLATCKSAPRSRQITMPAAHRSVFFTGRMPFLPPNQQCQSAERKLYKKLSYHRVTARCVLSVVILPITMQQCRKYLYNKP